MEVSAVRSGDVVLNPYNQGQQLRVRSAEPGMYDLIEITAIDMDGQQHLLRVGKDDMIKVVTGDEG